MAVEYRRRIAVHCPPSPGLARHRPPLPAIAQHLVATVESKHLGTLGGQNKQKGGPKRPSSAKPLTKTSHKKKRNSLKKDKKKKEKEKEKEEM